MRTLTFFELNEAFQKNGWPHLGHIMNADWTGTFDELLLYPLPIQCFVWIAIQEKYGFTEAKANQLNEWCFGELERLKDKHPGNYTLIQKYVQGDTHYGWQDRCALVVSFCVVYAKRGGAAYLADFEVGLKDKIVELVSS